MDHSFITQNDEDFELKDYLLEARLGKCPSAMMDENWSSSANDMLDSMFSMDLLNHSGDQQLGLDSFGDFCDTIKMESGDYENTVPSFPEILLSDENNVISSNSSDSGLSSDNLEAEMSPPYEPLSPPTLEPTTISDRGEKRSSVDSTCSVPIQPAIKKLCNNERKPKVIVQKVPQVMTLTNVTQKNSSPVQTPKLQQPVFIQQQNQPVGQQPQLVNSVRGHEIKFVKLSPQSFTTSNNKSVTIQVKNSSSGAKIQAKPGTLFLNKPKLTEMKKLVRVQNSNPRSILIPVTLQDVKELKTFKIVNTTAVRTTPLKTSEPVELSNQQIVKQVGKPKIIQTADIKQEASEDSFIENSSDSESIIIEDGYDNDDYIHDPEAPYPKLVLTTEEKRLLSKEGITLPTHYPLTKHEERELKRIRRKIRNKISAQDSRKRKKEYVDGLEERVKQCTEENQSLMKRIKQLQNQNQNLMSQMKRLQSLLTKGTNKTTQPTTCLMVLLLSLALVAAPNLKLGQNAKEGDLEEAVQETILQNRRNLLFNNKEQNVDIFDEEVNMSDIVSAIEFNNERECNIISKTNSNSYTSPALGDTKCKKMKLSHMDFIDKIDDENWYMLQKDHEKVHTEIKMGKQPENREHVQTSGFNIEKQHKTQVPNEATSWLDKDILDMVAPSGNGLYELSMDKVADARVFDVAPKEMYVNQLNAKQNSSQMRQIKKY